MDHPLRPRDSEALVVARERATQALFADLPRDEIIGAYLRAKGDEIASGKFGSPRSSAALAANALGFFVGGAEQASRLVWPKRLAQFDRPKRVRMEAQMAFPWRGGTRPWLDARVDADDWLVGIESKRLEPFLDEKRVAFSPVYARTDWGPAMAPFTAARDRLKVGDFLHLDVAQLIKHACGLRTQASIEALRPVLIYLYAEPRFDPAGKLIPTEAIAQHRHEIARFEDVVRGAEVSFFALSYKELLAAWSASGDAGLNAHAARLVERFDM